MLGRNLSSIGLLLQGGRCNQNELRVEAKARRRMHDEKPGKRSVCKKPFDELRIDSCFVKS